MKTKGIRFAALCALQAALALDSWRRYRSIPEMEGRQSRPIDATSDESSVSIIVPARNEADRLPRLLDSLNKLAYSNYEVIVVDDDSGDDTGARAESAGCKALRLGSLPATWQGKTWACWQGAQHATGEWLLFTDADTWHSPRSLSRAVDCARRHGVALLSLFPQQVCGGPWERLLLPYIYALYFAGSPGGRLNRAENRSALANGQYILVRRTEYWDSGGHAAIRDAVIDDVALARLFKNQGRLVLVVRGGSLVTVRMYTSLATIRQGFAKNSTAFIAADLRNGWRTVVASLVLSSSVPAFIAASTHGSRKRSLFPSLVATGVALSPWYREFRAPPAYALLYPLTALVFQTIALEGLWRSVAGGATWKGRRVS